MTVTQRDAAAHVAIFAWTPQALTGMCIGTYKVVANATPADARIIRSWYDAQCDWFCILMEHPSFDVVPAGADIPFHEAAAIERVQSA